MKLVRLEASGGDHEHLQSVHAIVMIQTRDDS
jgi:hypothetical protein